MRVFVHHADSYAGRAVAEAFLKLPVGWSLAEEAEDNDEGDAPAAKPTYQVVGTLGGLCDPGFSAPALTETVSDRHEAVAAALDSCDIVVYPIMDSEAEADDASWAVQHLADHPGASPKTFVLLSTILTWAKTKSSDPDDPELPLTEDDYRRRKGHANYKAHTAAEKLVIKLGKAAAAAAAGDDAGGDDPASGAAASGTSGAALHTYVIAAGLPYGAGEGPFHWLFKTAWMLAEPSLAVPGAGANVVPAIHVSDLARVVVNVAERRPEKRYLLAVDDAAAATTLLDVATAVAGALGPGKTHPVPKADALATLPGLTQLAFDQLTLDLRLEAAAVKDFRVEWAAQAGLVEALDRVVSEFRAARRLQPLRVVVCGAPASGKSTLAASIARRYKLEWLHAHGVVASHLARLEASAALLTSETDVDEDTKAQAVSDREALAALVAERDAHNGRFTDDTLLGMFRVALTSRASANHGYLLDGFPKTIEQAKALFAGEDEAPDAALLPEFVFNLVASDAALRNRVLELPESVVHGTHNTEEGFARRLTAYRELNTEEATVLNFYDELEIHPVDLAAEQQPADTVLSIVEAALGAPRHYGLSPAEAEEQARADADRAARVAAETAAIEGAAAAEAAAKKSAAEREWSAQWSEVHKQEEERLEAASQPLRHFLVKHVMPTLTQGLLEVCKVRPTDPVDYLAAYLFKHNPQID